jgi:copper chaperone
MLVDDLLDAGYRKVAVPDDPPGFVELVWQCAASSTWLADRCTGARPRCEMGEIQVTRPPVPVDIPTVETSTVCSATTSPLEKAMIAFEVNDMTCGHCASTITKALKAVDGNAKVQIDLAAHRVQVELTSSNADELAEAIKDAGYTPVQA